LAYFAAVFAVGFVLGVGRELVVRPHLGTLASIMVEAPAMLLASWAAARWVVRRGRRDYGWGCWRSGC
jgi:hypothetical protein